MRYEYRFAAAVFGIGYSECIPLDIRDFEEGLAYLKDHPFDEYMRHHLVERIAELDPDQSRELLKKFPADFILRSLFLESAVLGSISPENRAAVQELPSEATTPSLLLRCVVQPDFELHSQWARLFSENIQNHNPLPSPAKAGLPLLYSEQDFQNFVSLRDLALPSGETVHEEHPPVAQVAETATRALLEHRILTGREMRHQASLAPVGLVRSWKLAFRVRHDRLDYMVTGTPVSFGRGLDLDTARASCSMEIVERCSSYVGISRGRVVGPAGDPELKQGTISGMQEAGLDVLDPRDLPLEAPPLNYPLAWVEGQSTRPGADQVWVPAQCAYLFCNLDEPPLFASYGSTGLASGTSMAWARLSGLLEVIERDSEAVTPFHPARCFRIESGDREISSLLDLYKKQNIDLFFLDCTSELGIPCYSCFVTDTQGVIRKGTGAGLSGKKALLSAMTEVPFPFPEGPASLPVPEGIGFKSTDDLPDYSSGSIQADLGLVERLLAANSLFPVYVDLTRADLEFPVVRALVPGLEITADLDRFSRINPRLYHRYLELFENQS